MSLFNKLPLCLFMEKVLIEKVTLQHIHDLQSIGKTTFEETFAAYNTAENMQQYLEKSFHINQLKSEIENTNTDFYFAKYESTILGYLKLNYNAEKNALEIERIYVLQAYQGKKIGQLLFDKAKEIAKEKNVNYIWLGVWEENLKAINFYKKQGFITFDKHIFQLGNDAQTDILMQLILK